MFAMMSRNQYFNEMKQWFEDKPGDTLSKLLNNRHGLFYKFIYKDPFEYDFDEDFMNYDGPCPCCGSDMPKHNTTSAQEMFDNNLKNILETINQSNANEELENTGTPLHWVAWQYCNIPGSLEIAKKLIECGADVNDINRFGHTPLSSLCDGASDHNSFNDMDLVKVLLEAGADINLGNALYQAANRENTELVNYLISKGADVNQKNNKGNTPLSNAIKNPKNYSDEYMDKYNTNAMSLIDAGADLTLPNEYGRDAYNLAKTNKNKTIVEYIDSKIEKHTFVEWMQKL